VSGRGLQNQPIELMSFSGTAVVYPAGLSSAEPADLVCYVADGGSPSMALVVLSVGSRPLERSHPYDPTCCRFLEAARSAVPGCRPPLHMEAMRVILWPPLM
jgi:hypothetical protein